MYKLNIKKKKLGQIHWISLLSKFSSSTVKFEVEFTTCLSNRIDAFLCVKTKVIMKLFPQQFTLYRTCIISGAVLKWDRFPLFVAAAEIRNILCATLWFADFAPPRKQASLLKRTVRILAIARHY